MPYKLIIDDNSVKNAHTVTTGKYTNKLQNITSDFDVPPAGNSQIRYDKISMQDSQGQYIFDREISWEFLSNMQLINKPGQGKVARLCNVKLKPRQKRAGLGFDMHVEQYDIFKTKDFRQIHLTAKWDGVIVWPSMFFKFNDKDDEDELIEHISVYMADVLGYDDKKIKSLTNTHYVNIKNLNKTLKPKEKVWFTDWCQRNERSLRYDMYKDIV